MQGGAARSSGGTSNPSDEPVAPRAHKLAHCSCVHTEKVQLIIPETLRLIPQVGGASVGRTFWDARDAATLMQQVPGLGMELWGWRQGLKCPCHEGKGWE